MSQELWFAGSPCIETIQRLKCRLSTELLCGVFMPELDLLGWITVALCAMMVGVAKTGIPGVGILVVPLMATAFGSTSKSVGALLGILILADLFAITYHRRNAVWSHVLKLLPATLAGIVTAFFLLNFMRDESGEVNDQFLKPAIGIIVLIMLGINVWRRRSKARTGSDEGDDLESRVPAKLWFATIMGVMAGITTMMGNAAGPVMVIYLLAMRLPKVEFVGTAAWFFFIINWLKVPFSSRLDMMTWGTIKVDLLMLPFIALGALLGIYFLRRIPQKTFNVVAELLAAAAALNLIVSSLVKLIGN